MGQDSVRSTLADDRDRPSALLAAPVVVSLEVAPAIEMRLDLR